MDAMDIALPSGEKHPTEVFASDGMRLDGRGFEEFRRVFLKTGVISQAAGSAYAEFGRTKLMVGVYGPRQSDRREAFSETGHVVCEFKLASLPKSQLAIFQQSLEERELTALMETALESVVQVSTFPKLVLNVYCTVLESDGGVGDVTVAITAAALAIADAGVEMKDLVSACRVSKVGGTLLLDPSEQESYREEGGVVLAATGAGGEVAQLVTRGRWTDGELKEALELCLGGCEQLDRAGREVLKEMAVEKIAQQQREDAARQKQQEEEEEQQQQ